MMICKIHKTLIADFVPHLFPKETMDRSGCFPSTSATTGLMSAWIGGQVLLHRLHRLPLPSPHRLQLQQAVLADSFAVFCRLPTVRSVKTEKGWSRIILSYLTLYGYSNPTMFSHLTQANPRNDSRVSQFNIGWHRGERMTGGASL